MPVPQPAREGEGLEDLIARRFDQLSEDPMFPDQVSPDDFELRAVLDFLGPVEGRTILDVGCAKGLFCRALAAHSARMTGIDPSERFIEAAVNLGGAEYRVGSATALPFPDCSFDGLFSIEVMEHVPETAAALAELARVLKPGGRALVIDKNIWSLSNQWLVPNMLLRWLSESRNRWMYPKDFPFREIWFSPRRFQAAMARYFESVDVHYLQRPVNYRRMYWRGAIFRRLPFLNYDVAWVGRKAPSPGKETS